nr:MAG TPA: lytic transglycosylase [Caudoviricetes sp.]
MKKLNLFLLIILITEILLLPFTAHNHNQVRCADNQSVEVKTSILIKSCSAEDGSLHGDDIPASEYASLQSLINNEGISGLYENCATFKVTHYCGCSKCCGKYSGGSQSEAYGALGTKLTPYYSIAVDPLVIPLGTVLYDENGNEYKAEDTGSAIKGNRIDLFVGNHEEALKAGVNNITLYWNY